MSKIFALLAVALILTGVLVLAVPRDEASPGARSLVPQSTLAVPPYVMRAREIAEQINAPLSIVFGLISIYYSRRTYNVKRARAEAEQRRAS
jgi:hypothetical protein